MLLPRLPSALALTLTALSTLATAVPASYPDHQAQLRAPHQQPLGSPHPAHGPAMSVSEAKLHMDALASQLEAGLGTDGVRDEKARPERATEMSAAGKLTPDVMLSAPRRSGMVPNADGTLALYTVSTYSFEAHAKTKEIRLFDLQTRRSTLLTASDKAGEPHWLEGQILWLQEGSGKGTTDLVVASVGGDTPQYTAATVAGSWAELKLKTLAAGKVAVAGAARTTRGGDLYRDGAEPKRNHTATLYDSTFVRHWDSYVDTTTTSLWYGLFSLSSGGRYELSPLVNALAGSGLESPPPPFGGADSFDVGQGGLVFVAKDPELNPAFHTKCNFYYVDVPDFSAKPAAAPRLIQAKGLKGAATAPAMSPDGKMAVYMQMKEDGYEADKNRVVVVQDLRSGDAPLELHATDDGEGSWDLSPGKAVWGLEGRHIFLLAEHHGKGLVYDASIETESRHVAPRAVTVSGHTTDVAALAGPVLLLSGDTLTDNSVWSSLDLGRRSAPRVISSNSGHGAAFGLSHGAQVSETWFEGAEGRRVQAWVVRPSKAAAEAARAASGSSKLPLAMMIHGGPQGAWDDAWSTRWNPAVFAEQGYVVVAPNPTGSTSFGQAFTDAIYQNWGGAPYEDVAACLAHVESTMGDEVDTERAVALGASYGGYLVNWIQGHDLGRRFKALVCHDGVFSTSFAVAQEEQYFPVHDLGGHFWEARDQYDLWDPARHTGNWATPQLVIHSERDYRLAMSEGLAAFNVLQARGVPSRLLYFPDENHWVLKEENSRVWHTVVLNWVNSYVGLPRYADEDKIVGPAVGRDYNK